MEQSQTVEWFWSREIFYCMNKGERDVIPMMSEEIFPSQNLPVGIPPSKSNPYGGKSHLIRVWISLLLPASTMESPNTKTAGIVTLGGSFIKAVVVVHTWILVARKANAIKLQEKEKEEDGEAGDATLHKWNCIVLDLRFLVSFLSTFKLSLNVHLYIDMTKTSNVDDSLMFYSKKLIIIYRCLWRVAMFFFLNILKIWN